MVAGRSRVDRARVRALGRAKGASPRGSEWFDVLDSAIACVRRRFGLYGEAGVEFQQEAWLHVLSRGRLQRACADARSGRAYLVGALSNLFKDGWRTSHRRWRPSAKARRAGGIAVELERLASLDRLSCDEAVEVMTCKYAGALGRQTLEALADRFARPPAPRVAGIDVPATDPAFSAGADSAVCSQEAAAVAARLSATLREAVTALDQADRVILSRIYVHGRKLRDVAEEIGCPPREMYRRVERLHARLRERLIAHGLSQAEVIDALEVAGLDLQLLQ